MKIKIFEFETQEKECFQEFAERGDVECLSEALSARNAERHTDADIISPFIYSDLGSEVLEKMPDLKLIATRSTGYDHIDLEFCRKKGIKVVNVPSYGDNTVAEHVFALLLAISHRLIQAVDRTRKGDFSSGGLQGFDLKGRTIGVIGTGSIGEQVIRIAQGFGMNVLAFDVQPRYELQEKLEFQYIEFENLLQQSDVVTLHVPATEKTRNLISRNGCGSLFAGAVRGPAESRRSGCSSRRAHCPRGGRSSAFGI